MTETSELLDTDGMIAKIAADPTCLVPLWKVRQFFNEILDQYLQDEYFDWPDVSSRCVMRRVANRVLVANRNYRMNLLTKHGW